MSHFRLNENGTFDVLDGRRVVLANAFARLTYADGRGSAQTVKTTSQADEATLSGDDRHVKLDLRVENDALTLTCHNHGAGAITLDVFEVLCCDRTERGALKFERASELLYLHHGWQSWSKTEIRSMTVPELAFNGDDFFEKHLPYGAADGDERTSNAFTLVAKGGEENATLIGFETGAKQFSQIRFGVQGTEVVSVRAVAYGDGAQLDAGGTFESERLMIGFGDANALYEEYAERVGKNMGRRGTRATIQGWCSWYYYFGENTAADVRANLDAALAQDIPLEVILIDDGYEKAIGDWTSIQPEKFPDGMAQLAKEIRAAGKLPGIWLAPFGASRDSQLAQTHPEFFLEDAQGQMVRAWNHWNADVYALDLTRPDVAKWLADLFHTVIHEWGFQIVKLDFLFAGALAGKHFDPQMTRAQAYRRGLEIIGQALGDENLILGCGAPQLASVGLVDTMRVSQDVSFAWAPFDPANGGAVSTQHAVQNTLLRAPFNQHWWLNDPDCVIVRKKGDVNGMSRNENRTLASVAALTGSILLDSDNLAVIEAAYLQDLRRILPATARTARVRKWFSTDAEQPSQVELELEDGGWVLAAINWSRGHRQTVIGLPDEGTYRVYDFWSKKDLGIHHKRIRIPKHAPHQTIVLHCVPTTRGEKSKPALNHIAKVSPDSTPLVSDKTKLSSTITTSP